MKQRHVRSGDHIDDDAEVVVRGGDLDVAVIRVDARRMHEVYGVYGISVPALRGATLDELAQQTPLVRFSQLALVMVGAIRDAGLVLEPTGRNPRHYTVVLPDIDVSVETLCLCERRLWTNPYYEE
jgi:hypothetical protein